ncbi:aspartate-semialdehyde dehydrogenase [Buchnera aphidicola]|uniref:aspartate-semialdehyde dehydrogenase n=1 Tax=Buchnera aphidicola TaxID=9 RepID=UPI003464618C
MIKKVGFIGWRGIVGSVLMRRMIEENNFENIDATFFSTSQIGSICPLFLGKNYILNDAYDFSLLKNMDIIVSCQGSEYTDIVYNKLRSLRWNGYWIDASSSLRMNNDSIIVLDPVNIQLIKKGIYNGIKTFVGGNCTVSLMLMALGGLFQNNLIESLIFSTYQAASGAGSKHIIELIRQMGYLYNIVSSDLNNISISILDIEKKISNSILELNFPKKQFGTSLAGNVLPWIDVFTESQQTKEEWKVQEEANKILNQKNNICIDGTCVRVGALRCHSQSFFIKLRKNLSCDNLTEIIQNHNDWIRVIPNDYKSTIKYLTPISVSGTLNISVGRIRKLNVGSNIFSVFTVGDQLLWGAAEPLRRILMLLLS